MSKYEPNTIYELDIWKAGDSFVRLPVGLGLNKETGQVLLFFGSVTSSVDPAWWMVAERQIELLYFFLDHKIYFDGQLGKSGKHYRKRGGYETFEIHFAPEAYQEFLKLLDAKMEEKSGKPVPYVPSRKMYSLVGVIALILNSMDYEQRMSMSGFVEELNHLLDILEEEAST